MIFTGEQQLDITFYDVGIKANIIQLSQSLGIRKVKLSRPPSILYIDPRVKLDTSKLDLIKNQIRERIFVLGWNASGEQTLPALSYESPRGLYRYLTGTLFNSLRVYTIGNDQLAMEFRYPEVILATLEDRYGLTFQWSDYEIAFVDKLQSDEATRIGIPPLGETSRAERIAGLVDPDALRILQERDSKRAKSLEEEQKRLRDEKEAYDRAKKAREESDGRTTREAKERDRAASPVLSQTHEVRYDPRAPLDILDYADLENRIKSRIRNLGLDANDSLIPARYREDIIDYRTIQSIKITKPTAGTLRMKVIYYDDDVIRAENQAGAVYDFAPSDIAYIDSIVTRKLNMKNLTKNIDTQKVN